MRIYGPVPSRRFGLSLGVDIVPHKTCTFDCVYCQLGPTDHLAATTRDFYNLDEVLADVEDALDGGPPPDVVTLAGSGEPTLYRQMGPLIDGLRSLVSVPILLITNASMLWQEEVMEAALKADILAPSLDAGDERIFRRINRAHPQITFEKLLNGLRRVTHKHRGEIRLEVMLVRDINDDEQSLKAIAQQLGKLRFDRVDVNTPVRPPVPERGALPCFQEVLDQALEIFGPKANAIGAFNKSEDSHPANTRSFNDLDKDIREMLLRRPCTVDDIASSLGLHRQTVIKSLDRLTVAGLVDSRPGQAGKYFHVPSKNSTILQHNG